MNKSDLSRFVEDVVRWRVLEHTVEALRRDKDDLEPGELDQLLDESLDAIRGERRRSTT